MARFLDRRTFLVGTGAAAAAVALAACGNPGATAAPSSATTPSSPAAGSSSGLAAPSGGAAVSSSAEPAVSKLVFLSNNQDPTAKPTVDMWNSLKKSFTVELRATDAAQYSDAFPRLAIASDAPNIAGYFIDGGHFTDLAKAGALLDMTELWEKSGLMTSVPDLIKKKYSTFTPDGKFYAAPTNTSRYGILFYRKSVLKAAGVAEPGGHIWASEDEWNKACEALLTKGISPLSVGGKDGYPISHLQDGLLSSTMPPEMVGSPLDIDYTSDAWKAPVNKLVEWNKKGWFAKGFLGRSTDQGNTLFAQSKVGFSTGMNVWQPLVTAAGVPLEDLGWCMLPPIGKLPTKISIYAGGGIVIPKIAPGHDQALEFGEWLVAPDQALEAAKTAAVIPGRTDIPGLQAALGPIGGSMYALATDSTRSQYGWDDPAPTDMITYDRTNLQAVLAGTLSVDDFSNKLESLKKGHQ